MNNKIFILSIMLLQVQSQQYSITACTCQDLLSEIDCINNITTKCSWDGKNSKCNIFTTTDKPIKKYIQYCDSYNENDCPQKLGCAWLSNKCMLFTGCTAYDKKDNSECQAINRRCISDGTHCVEIDACKIYKKQLSCVKNAEGSLCYWDTTNNICVDVITCYQLPSTLQTDRDCRDAISICTVIPYGGCVESGNECSDQKLEIQCFWNKLQTTACYWDGIVCKDRICENAPPSFTTDDACIKFRTDGTCTTKANGGCVTRTTCADAKIEESCIKNSSGDDCYWTGTTCFDKTCANAPTTMKTNSACAKFVKGCITKSGGGCVANGACSAAKIQEACVRNSSNFDCIWDITCKEKTCDNAPIIITRNEECEAYLNGNNCITKTGGGCVKYTTCASITLEDACVIEQSCFWDTQNSSCKDKTCVNAPADNISHELCQAFLNTCTVNSIYAGCVEKTCENQMTQFNCDKDASNKLCIWKGKCYKKQCVLAPSFITTHADCQAYHYSCTLNNSGIGCVPLPLKCQAITIEAACQMQSNKKPCGWNGSQCIDKGCSTASKTFTTTSECNEYLSICVANNPIIVNGFSTIEGCQDLPKNCTFRKSVDNCQISRFGYPTCLWDSFTEQCVEKSCATASNFGTAESLQGEFTVYNCRTYLNTCISNNSADGCIVKPFSCSSLVQSNCQIGSKQSGDCYWNGNSCVDRICTNIIQTTHANCNAVYYPCTVNNLGTACQPLATNCTSYLSQENCKITEKQEYCIWTGFSCRNATCADAPDSSLYDSDSECFTYPTPNEKCTVIYKVGAQGCVKKQANCSDYKTQTQCHKTITNLTVDDDCKWVIDKCYDLSIFSFGTCRQFKGTQRMCQEYKDGCTNIFSAESSVTCTLDCNLKRGSGLTFADCQALDYTCSVKKDGSGCIYIQSTCYGYESQIINCFRSSASANAGYCVMNDFQQCQPVNQASECRYVTGLIDMDHRKCQLYHFDCTALNDGTGCQEYKSRCSDYETANNCSISVQGKCFFDGIYCVRFSNCASIIGIGLNNTICSSYHPGCTAYANGIDCQEKMPVCDLYFTQNSCTISAALPTANKCVWTGTACISIQNYNIADCAYVTGHELTDEICASYHVGCTVNRYGTACQVKKATCYDYAADYASCSISAALPTANKCVWTGTACISIQNYNIADCAYVTGYELTDEICASYNVGCTVNRYGTACQVKRDQCSDYFYYETTCSISTANKCVWTGTQCISITTVAIDCAYITGYELTDEICASYNVGCTMNRYGTACQEKLATCSYYAVNYVSCSISTSSKCVWTGMQCVSVTTVATDCAYITGYKLTDEICASYHQDCTANRYGTACQSKLAICYSYTADYAACSISASLPTANKCVWTGTQCISVITTAIECAYITGYELTGAICASYNVGCINVKDGSGCQEAKPNCKDYITYNSCSTQTNSFLSCLWMDNSCYPLTSVNCSAITGVDLDHAQCKAYNPGCIAVSDGTKCQDYKQTCEEYPGTPLGCIQNYVFKCYLYGSNCITIRNAASDCAKITGAPETLTYEICQSYHPKCSVNRTKSACVQQQIQCSEYTHIQNCYKSETGLCIASTDTDTDTDTACVSVFTATNCDSIYLGIGNYSSKNCNEMKAGCTNNGTIGCTAKTCANASGIAFNHANCNSWLNSCTVNTENSACRTMAVKCSAQSQFFCLQAFEGECVVVGTSCVRKTCDNAAIDFTRDDDNECSSYLQSCTVARLGGCQARAACSSYISSLQCKFNNSGGKCFWNPSQKICVDLNCGNIEATTLYDTHNECVVVDETLACTVRATNGTAIQGCMDRGACSSYTIEEQCKTNSSYGICVWNTNSDQPTPVCQDKSCTTAPTSTKTHYDCYAYYETATVKCTVVATPSNSGGNPILGGCQQTTDCSNYIDIEQCQINANGDPCVWNGTSCADKSCTTAPIDYDDDTKCREYITNKCTVSDSGYGCVDIPVTCETMKQNQCYYNKAGDPCYWTGIECIKRSCENAPEGTITADDCNTYLTGCTLDNIKCKTKICEDFEFGTDYLCKQSISTCTTNGKNCVTRGSCLQAQDKAGCILSSAGEQCEWIPDNDINSAYCTIKTCSTASDSLITEEQCQQYFRNCTTKKGGGCIEKSSCANANVESACTTAFNGLICVWDSIKQLCRDYDCQDIDGTLHDACQSRKSDCTTGLNGRCAKIQNCEQTNIRAACIVGLNGPCLWIDQYLNQDGSKGACFQYTSCQSLSWKTDQQCKQINDQCTTDGSKCVAITLCSETNINGGCVTGSDGLCVQSVLELNSLEPAICQPYKSCEKVFYITHEQCQQANKNCTTNGKTSCIDLTECSSYQSQVGCVINKTGLIVQSGIVKSTGLCTWDAKNNQCRDQDCSDYIKTTHRECFGILSTCTSNGETCIKQEVCSSYTTQVACETAVGSDGICFWEYASLKNNNNATCRLLICQDIQNSLSNNVCLASSLSCVIDNDNICIPKANCSTYTSKSACNYGGLDGICIFKQQTGINSISGIGTCTLMRDCSAANDDQNACQAAKDRCLWIPELIIQGLVTPSKCSALDCTLNWAKNGYCNRILNWDKKSQQMCKLINGTCVSINPIDLSFNECLKISGYTYTWNASKNQCQVCKSSESNSNQNNVTVIQQKNEKTESTSSNQILSIIGLMVIDYLI